MPQIGDTKTIFGRTYVYSNPNQALGPGTWLLSDGEGSLSGNQQSEHVVYGQAIVDDASIPIKRGMLVRVNSDGKAEAAVATSLETARVVGVAIDPANVGQIVQYTQNTVFEFFNASTITDEGASTLDIGKPYYLSAVNVGKWTKSPNRLIEQNEIMQCGTAVGEYYMAIDIQPIEPKQNQEAAIREEADNALSARIDVLERDAATASELSAEATARAAADALHEGRLDALELADTATSSLINAIEANIDAIEADTTAQTLSDAALVAAKAYTDQQMAGIPNIDYSIDYGEYA